MGEATKTDVALFISLTVQVRVGHPLALTSTLPGKLPTATVLPTAQVPMLCKSGQSDQVPAPLIRSHGQEGELGYTLSPLHIGGLPTCQLSSRRLMKVKGTR